MSCALNIDGLPPAVEAAPLDRHIWLIELIGDCDLACADQLRAAIERGVGLGYRNLLVDLQRATLLDCAMLGVLVTALSSLRRDADAAVALAAPRGAVARLLEALPVGELFDIHDDRHQATAGLDGNGGPPPREGWKAITAERPSPLLRVLARADATDGRASRR